jgi:hypothetical protein
MRDELNYKPGEEKPLVWFSKSGGPITMRISIIEANCKTCKLVVELHGHERYYFAFTRNIPICYEIPLYHPE